MEKPELKHETVLIKKGFFYFLFKLLAMPFKAIGFLCKFVFKYISIYFGWYKEHLKWKEKQKDLNKILSIKTADEEIL